MNILVLAKKMPYPKRDGESIAIDVLAKGLNRQGACIDLLAMNTSKHYSSLQLDAFQDHPFNTIELVDIDNRINFFDAFKNLFSKESYHISRFICSSYKTALIEKLKSKSFDIIQLETLYLCPYIDIIKQYSNAKIVLRAHNVEHEIWDRIQKNEANFLKRAYLKYLIKKLYRFEIQAMSAVDMLLPISSRDARIFESLGFKGKLAVVPIGIESNGQVKEQSFNNPITFGFIGSLDWLPNQEGLNWFVEKVWKPFQKDHPSYNFNVAGRNTPSWMHTCNWPNTTIHGEVDSAEAFTTLNDVMVVPLLSGSGMRAKILEALALGRNVITTSVGIEGIDAKALKAVYVADDPKTFRHTMSELVQQNGEVRKNGIAAQKYIVQEYDYGRIGFRLHQVYEQLLPTVVL